MRIDRADRLRLAALGSIVLFHVALTDAQQAARHEGPNAPVFDALIGLTAVLDNRSLATLSLFLLFVRHGGDPYPGVMAARARRLLVPYLAWTLLYPVLDLLTATLAGDPAPALARLHDPHAWLTGVLLATTKQHLHFLPTLLLLSLLLPLYRIRLPVAATVALLAATSALRAGAESVIIGAAYHPATADLAALSAVRLLEYLPLGLLAYALAAQPAAPLRPLAAAARIAPLVAASLLLRPGAFPLGPDSARLAWSLTQSVLGTLAMALTAQAFLQGARADRSVAGRPWYGRDLADRALAIFLVHPFLADLFDAVVGAPSAYELRLLLPKLAFVLLTALLAASFLVGTPGLRRIV